VNVRWIVFAFASGVAVGVLVTRVSMERPEALPSAAIDATASAPPRPAVPANDFTHAAAARPVKPSDESAETGTVPPAPAMQAEHASVPVDDESVQRIDAGPIFNEVIARPSQPGFENQLGDAHRALERETRNDGWAYSMEGEIQNSMVNEVSTGEFRADHVECRATLCEVRLSGKGNQAAAIKRWSESLGPQPFGQRLFLNYSSSISNDERADSIMIFRKPPASPPRPH
jgi:hypothetical protein